MAPSGASFGVYSRRMRLSGKAATGVVTILRSVRRSTGRGSGLAVSLRRSVCHSLAGGPGGSRRMVHHSDRDPRPGDAALVIGDLVPHPRRFIRPAVW